MKLTAAAQEALLAILCYDNKAAQEVSLLVPANFYDPFFSEIAEEASKYYATYGTVPGAHTLDIVELLSSREPEKEEFYTQIYRSLQTTKESINSQYVISQASSFMRYQGLKRALGGAVRALQQEDETGLLEAEATLKKALETNYGTHDIGVDLADTERSMRFLRSEDASSFPTGIKALDERGLGPARKRLGLFIGLAGSGKSWWLAHLAKHAYMSRHRVLYVTLELSEEELCQRVFQGFFSISKRKDMPKMSRLEQDEKGKFIGIRPAKELKRPSMEDAKIDEVIQDKADSLRENYLRIKEFPTGSLSVKDLENYLDILEAKSNFIPDLLIIDYADLMSLDSKNYRLDVGQLYKNLRGIANKRNMAIFTASQANRAAVKSKWLKGDSASEDWSKIATCDLVLTFNQTPVEFELGLARLFVAKGRTDRDKFAILISQAYAIGQFCLDSVAYTPNYWDDLQGHVTDAVDGD